MAPTVHSHGYETLANELKHLREQLLLGRPEAMDKDDRGARTVDA
jgi:hypothetical protein